jgi:hypothetical protein
LQTLGAAGDVAYAAGALFPPALPAAAALGTALKAPRASRVASRIKVTKTADVSDTFGEGAKSVTYTDPDSGGFIEVVQRKDGPTSVLGLEVPEQFRGSGIGQELQAAAMADNPMLQGQVSSKAAAVGAYRLGRRPVGKPDATLDEVFGMIDDQSSVLMKRPDPNQAAGAAMDLAQARYFDTGKFEPPTAENPVSVVLPTETEPGIIAFHGSGADFDEFRLEMIGTGEGNQAYGYGLYFTDSEDIAKFYKETVGQERNQIQFKGKPLDSVYTADIYENFGDDISQIIKKAKEMGVAGGDEEIIEDAVIGVFANLSQGLSNMKDAQTAVDSLRSGRSTGFSPEKTIYRFFIEPEVKEADIPEGKMYKVALSPKPDELLDYDAPLSQQPKMLKLIDDVHGDSEIIIQQAGLDPATATGGDFVKALGGIGTEQGARAASEFLAKAGIPGLKYRASGSRGAGTTDEAAERNYVIFDDKAVKILEKYGIAGPVLVTGAAVAASKAGNDNEDGGSILPDAGII